MLIIPAIDLKNGKVVRLLRGNFADKTIYSSDPVKAARNWQGAGARYLHIVDLDGAERGRLCHLELIRKIIKKLKIPVEVGGGIREAGSIRQVLDCGAARVVLGTKIQDEAFLRVAIREFRQRIIISIDAQEEEVQVSGWQEAYKNLSVLGLAKKLKKIGFKQIIYTDINRDGALGGPNIIMIKRILNDSGLRLIASGGISSLEDLLDLKALSKLGLDGAIVGKALYEGKFTLREAQELCRKKKAF